MFGKDVLCCMWTFTDWLSSWRFGQITRRDLVGRDLVERDLVRRHIRRGEMLGEGGTRQGDGLNVK